jgi:hypothetical protein
LNRNGLREVVLQSNGAQILKKDQAGHRLRPIADSAEIAYGIVVSTPLNLTQDHHFILSTTY